MAHIMGLTSHHYENHSIRKTRTLVIAARNVPRNFKRLLLKLLNGDSGIGRRCETVDLCIPAVFVIAYSITLNSFGEFRGGWTSGSVSDHSIR